MAMEVLALTEFHSAWEPYTSFPALPFTPTPGNDWPV